MPFLLLRSLIRAAPSTQGHVEAAAGVGCIYFFGQGVAVDCKRALAAYKTGAQGGNANCQYQLGVLFSHEGYGVKQDNKQALRWLEKAAAQDYSLALDALGVIVEEGRHGACPPSYRRAREFYRRAIGLGCAQAAENMRTLQENIRQVTRSHTFD